jgi:GGDEF domain-containing protein
MKTSRTKRQLRLKERPHPIPTEDNPFLMLGGSSSIVPDRNLLASSDQPLLGIILVGRVESGELGEVVEQLPDPAIPIADFGNNHELRRDFVGEGYDGSRIEELKQQFAPIWRRLDEFPFRAGREDRAEMALLRLAYSRAAMIEARLAADSPLLVEYPMLGRSAALRQRLEMLAGLDLLRRQHFTRTYVCSRCTSARLHVREVCPACGGQDLAEEALVHHYRCGWKEPESHFVDGRELVCPKCRRELRHFGVDYEKPGSVSVCRGCGTANAEPVVQFLCLECAGVTPTVDARWLDWHHYELTEEGLRALREGRVPRFEIAPLLEGRTRAFSFQEFRLLATESLRVSRRYERPFTLARLSLANVDDLRSELGPLRMDLAFRIAVDAIVEALREADFVGADGATSVMIGFPETPADHVKMNVVERVRGVIRKTIAVPLELAADITEGDAAFDLLAKK